MKYIRYLAVGLAGLLLGADSALATTYEFEVLGDINAPVHVQNPFYTGPDVRFTVNLAPGQLTALYDNKNTESLADDTLRLFNAAPISACLQVGTCGGHISRANDDWRLMRVTNPISSAMGRSYTGDQAGGVPLGRIDNLQFNILATGPMAGTGNPLDGFTFGAQSVGTISIADPGIEFPRWTPVQFKTHPAEGYAFRINPLGDSSFLDGAGWLQMFGGFLGASDLRLEFGEHNAALNWDLRFVPKNLPPVTPPTEVPEPGTLATLGAALVAAYRRRKKQD